MEGYMDRFWGAWEKTKAACLTPVIGMGPVAAMLSPGGIFLFFVLLLAGAFVSVSFLGNPPVTSDAADYSSPDKINEVLTQPFRSTPPNVHFACPDGVPPPTCPSSLPPPRVSANDSLRSSGSCPDYFRWIYEDLRPWAATGVTREAVERAARDAAFRLTIVDGRVYWERYHGVFQTRDVFTLWGILQLTRHYPGRLPDLDVVFNLEDMPVVRTVEFTGPGKPIPPPLFRYCKDGGTMDIVFPDWSFWGWPEINIKPWEQLLGEMKAESEKKKWIDREPYAYWKGNTEVARTRKDLMKCNGDRWNARLYEQDWVRESKQGYKNSNLAAQCKHRYKIYIEGRSWSVSEKYILACDSPTLFVRSQFIDFFTRGLVPGRHYWPIRNDDKCRSIKFAVDWGNNHAEEAQAIGKAGSGFMQEMVSMNNVYDYMFHLLSEYSKLLQYKPTVPPKAVELCMELLACPAIGLIRRFLEESAVDGPHDSAPCSMPPPFKPYDIKDLFARNANSTKQVELLEQKAWEGKWR